MVQTDVIAPWGVLKLMGDANAVRGVAVADGASLTESGSCNPVLKICAEQLLDYFSGRRRQFTVPVYAMGTPFQRRVWSAVRAIPYGQTCTYAELAQRCAVPKAVRAVAGALARNPVLILVPCHRVVGQGGALTGYAGGLTVKARLLELERQAGQA